MSAFFSKSSDVLPVFSCAVAIGILCSIRLGADIAILFPWVDFNANILLSKALITNCQPSEKTIILSKVSYLFFLSVSDPGINLLVNYEILSI